jgi:hypothetical protein
MKLSEVKSKLREVNSLSVFPKKETSIMSLIAFIEANMPRNNKIHLIRFSRIYARELITLQVSS